MYEEDSGCPFSLSFLNQFDHEGVENVIFVRCNKKNQLISYSRFDIKIWNEDTCLKTIDYKKHSSHSIQEVHFLKKLKQFIVVDSGNSICFWDFFLEERKGESGSEHEHSANEHEQNPLRQIQVNVTGGFTFVYPHHFVVEDSKSLFLGKFDLEWNEVKTTRIVSLGSEEDDKRTPIHKIQFQTKIHSILLVGNDYNVLSIDLEEEIPRVESYYQVESKPHLISSFFHIRNMETWVLIVSRSRVELCGVTGRKTLVFKKAWDFSNFPTLTFENVLPRSISDNFLVSGNSGREQFFLYSLSEGLNIKKFRKNDKRFLGSYSSLESGPKVLKWLRFRGKPEKSQNVLVTVCQDGKIIFYQYNKRVTFPINQMQKTKKKRSFQLENSVGRGNLLYKLKDFCRFRSYDGKRDYMVFYFKDSYIAIFDLVNKRRKVSTIKLDALFSFQIDPKFLCCFFENEQEFKKHLHFGELYGCDYHLFLSSKRTISVWKFQCDRYGVKVECIRDGIFLCQEGQYFKLFSDAVEENKKQISKIDGMLIGNELILLLTTTLGSSSSSEIVFIQFNGGSKFFNYTKRRMFKGQNIFSPIMISKRCVSEDDDEEKNNKLFYVVAKESLKTLRISCSVDEKKKKEKVIISSLRTVRKLLDIVPTKENNYGVENSCLASVLKKKRGGGPGYHEIIIVGISLIHRSKNAAFPSVMESMIYFLRNKEVLHTLECGKGSYIHSFLMVKKHVLLTKQFISNPNPKKNVIVGIDLKGENAFFSDSNFKGISRATSRVKNLVEIVEQSHNYNPTKMNIQLFQGVGENEVLCFVSGLGHCPKMLYFSVNYCSDQVVDSLFGGGGVEHTSQEMNEKKMILLEDEENCFCISIGFLGGGGTRIFCFKSLIIC